MIVSLQDESVIINLDLKRRVTLIPGESGSGKTYLYRCIGRIQSRHPKNAQVYLVDNLEAFRLIPSCEPSIVLIDKPEQYLLDEQLVDMVSKVQDKHFIVFIRSGMKMPATLRDLAELVWEHSNTKTAYLRYYWG